MDCVGSYWADGDCVLAWLGVSADGLPRVVHARLSSAIFHAEQAGRQNVTAYKTAASQTGLQCSASLAQTSLSRSIMSGRRAIQFSRT